MGKDLPSALAEAEMRQVHAASEKLFVDFDGRTAEVVDASIGRIILVQIFVAMLGACSFTHAEASWSQERPASSRLVPRADAQPDVDRHDAALRYLDRSGAPVQAS